VTKKSFSFIKIFVKVILLFIIGRLGFSHEDTEPCIKRYKSKNQTAPKKLRSKGERGE